MSDDSSLRQAAVHSLARKRAFWGYVGGAIILNLLMIGIWFLSGKGYFWPVWVMLGSAIGLGFSAWGTFGPGSSGPSEDQIQSEMKKLQG